MNHVIFEQKPKAIKEDRKDMEKHNKYGKVPQYINKFNKQREDRAAKKAYEDEMAKLPPGTRMMPEAERLSTLDDLAMAKAETNKALERLPIVAHSMRGEKHKKDLEEKLMRLDRAIDTFSKDKVYV